MRRFKKSAADRTDRGAGLIGAVAGLLVTLMLLAFAVQMMLGLYATSTLRATLHDAASRAANEGAADSSRRLARLADEAEASLGSMGQGAEIVLESADTDGDDAADVIVGQAVAAPPRVVPPSIGGMIGFDEIHAGARVRIERFR